MKNWTRLLPVFLVFIGCLPGTAQNDTVGQPLYVGWASTDITPTEPINLTGHTGKRIATSVRDPLTATVLALETRGDDGTAEQAIMVSCDVLFTREVVQKGLRIRVERELPDLDTSKLFMNATHTHTAPGFVDGAFRGLYDVSQDEGVMKASEYTEFFLERVTPAIVEAWRSRKPGGMSWALGHAVVGLNRRAKYFDGSAAMYGKTDREDFSHIEGYDDHGVKMLFLWKADGTPSGIIINVACPSQETEGLRELSADFWHDTREELRRRISKDFHVLAQCGASGDLSPHRMFRKQAEDAMRERRGISWRQEIARRIANTVEDVLPGARERIQTRVRFDHTVASVDLPLHEPAVPPFYETDSVQPIEFHAVRIGDIAVATNPFELYLDYGIRIEARSPALLTFVTQLSCQHSGYLPTERAIEGGGYSADKFIVGPEGGQVLVDETVKRLHEMWD